VLCVCAPVIVLLYAECVRRLWVWIWWDSEYAFAGAVVAGFAAIGALIYCVETLWSRKDGDE